MCKFPHHIKNLEGATSILVIGEVEQIEIGDFLSLFSDLGSVPPCINLGRKVNSDRVKTSFCVAGRVRAWRNCALTSVRVRHCWAWKTGVAWGGGDSLT